MIMHYRKLMLLFGWAIMCIASRSVAVAGEENAGKWDLTGAAKYLDGREREWFQFGSAHRGDGESRTTCVSCHSLLPYALARPALRELSGEKKSTEYESRILAQVKSRVTNWDQLDTPEFQLSYDFDEDKKKQSRGTEAVLYALILARNDRVNGLPQPEPITKSALANLWATQIKEGQNAGSWEWLNFGLEPWEASSGRFLGATLSAIAVGSAPGGNASQEDEIARKGFSRLRDYLQSNVGKQNLHNGAWYLWAVASVDGLSTPEEKKQLIDRLLAKQQPDGGWSLHTLGDYKTKDVDPKIGQSDGYATGLILHVLRLAGVPKTDSHMMNGRAWLRSHQQASGGWTAWSLNKIRQPESSDPGKANVGKFMWDAATALAVLALGD
jgi:squalene-hopene/tetraprenyl-beta-curcumene cyclase